MVTLKRFNGYIKISSGQELTKKGGGGHIDFFCIAFQLGGEKKTETSYRTVFCPKVKIILPALCMHNENATARLTFSKK